MALSFCPTAICRFNISPIAFCATASGFGFLRPSVRPLPVPNPRPIDDFGLRTMRGLAPPRRSPFLLPPIVYSLNPATAAKHLEFPKAAERLITIPAHQAVADEMLDRQPQAPSAGRDRFVPYRQIAHRLRASSIGFTASAPQ